MKTPIAVILLAVLLGGCSTPSYNYYMLKVESPQVDVVVENSVGLMPVNIPGWLNDVRMSWSDGEVKVFRSEGERWGTDLGKEMDRALSENISRQLGGTAVTTGPWFGDQRPKLVAKVDLDNLVMTENVVELVARWQLLDKKGKILVQSDEQVIWVVETEYKDKGLRLALGVSQAVAGMSADIVEAVHNVGPKKMEP